MPKNYYVILGIPSDSSLDDIKSAFRKLAKEFHPDYFGKPESPFPAIQEAYSVLSDPERRRKYDQSLESARMHITKKRRPGDYPGSHDQVEPLIPEESRAEAESLRGPRRPAAGSLQSLRPEFGSLFDRFFDTASERWNSRRETAGDREYVVTLTEEQARRGGHFRLQVPARTRCPECGGGGRTGFYECRRCFGSGYLQGEIPLLLNYPAHMDDNHTVKFALHRCGIGDFGITIRFRKENSASGA